MDESIKEKKITKPIERATISDSLKDKLAHLAAQATESLQGITSVTKSDIVNLLIEEHPAKLSVTQLNKLKATHIDEVKYAFWIAERLKVAREAGEKVTIQDLLSQNHPCISATKRTRRKRKQSEDSVTSIQDSHSSNDQGDI